jgi:uncharacterized protein YukE
MLTHAIVSPSQSNLNGDEKMQAFALAVPCTDATLTRPTHEIDAELFRLYARVNQTVDALTIATLRAQIAVLRERLSAGEAGERYEDAHLDIQSAASDAADWLRDEGTALSA